MAGAATVTIRVGFVLVAHRYVPHGVFLFLGIICPIPGAAIGKRFSRWRRTAVVWTPAVLLIAGMVLIALGLA